MIESGSDDLFVASLVRAIARCATAAGIPTAEDWPRTSSADDAPLPYEAKLPRGVAWNQRHDRIDAFCYIGRYGRIRLGYFPPTIANAALAGRMAVAARACRDAGGNEDAIKAAGKAVRDAG